MTVADVLEQVKALSPEERKELANLLIGLVDLDTTSLQRRLSALLSTWRTHLLQV